MSTKQKSVAIVSFLLVLLTAGSFVHADEYYAGGVTTDIDYEILGYLWIEDATVNLLDGAHIKTDDTGYVGDVYATSGTVLNIYGGVIDSYLYVTTSYNEFPEAQVTIYGSEFVIGTDVLTEDTTEVFSGDGVLSGVYQDGTPFSHHISCFEEGDFKLMIKLGWTTSKPNVEVAPLALDFGNVKLGKSATQVVTVANTGNASLYVQQPEFTADSSTEFTTPVVQYPVTVEPGATITIEVVFTPAETGEAQGVFVINSDDPETPAIEVTLTGVGTSPAISVEPNSIDFGQLEIGDSATQIVTIANNGDADLIVESITWTDDSSVDFAAEITELPLTIEAGAVAELSIIYTPTAEGAVAGTLEIISDDTAAATSTVTVVATAVNPVVSPEQQIADIITFFNASVLDNSIQGFGPRIIAKLYLEVMRQLLLLTQDLIEDGRDSCAIIVLKEIDKLSDGNCRPRDLIVGSNVAEFNVKVNTLIDTLEAE